MNDFAVETRNDRKEWLELRKQGVGSSEAGALWGESTFASPRSVYESKVNGIEPDIDPEWAEMGNLLEPIVAEIYKRRSGRNVMDPGSSTTYRSRPWPWMIASLDRFIVGGQDAKGHGLLECKSRQAWAVKEWDEAVPLDTVLQVQHALAVTGWQWGVIGVLFGNRPRFIELERDDELIAMHVEKCRVFWEAVQAKRPPAVDAHSATLDAIKRRYIAVPGKVVQLDDGALAVWRQLDALKTAIKLAEKSKSELEAQLRDTMKDAEAGMLPDGAGFLRITTVKGGPVPASVRKSYTKLSGKKV